MDQLSVRSIWGGGVFGTASFRAYGLDRWVNSHSHHDYFAIHDIDNGPKSGQVRVCERESIAMEYPLYARLI